MVDRVSHCFDFGLVLQETHLVLLVNGGVFQKHSKGSLKPVSLSLSTDRHRLEWRSMELGKAPSSSSGRLNLINIGDITSIEMDGGDVGVTFRIVSPGQSLTLDAGSSEHRLKWVAALREAMVMLTPERLQQGDPASDIVQQLAMGKMVRPCGR